MIRRPEEEGDEEEPVSSFLYLYVPPAQQSFRGH